MPTENDVINYTQHTYKYKLVGDTWFATGITQFAGGNEYVKIHPDGSLWLRSGYSWDGPSGPAIDTPDFMRGSLCHDALYQLIREEVLPQSTRKQADKEMNRINKEDGMFIGRRFYTFLAVRYFGKFTSQPKKDTIYYAPRRTDDD